MLRRLAVRSALAAGLVVATGCSSIVEGMLESALQSRKEDRRAKYYEKRGVNPDRARRMVFEDKVWGDL